MLSTSALLDLPNELLIRITQDPDLTPKDLLSLCATSKDFLRLTIPTYLQRYNVPCDARYEAPCEAFPTIDISGQRIAPILHGLSLSPAHLTPCHCLRCVLNIGYAAVRETRVLARVIALVEQVREVELDLNNVTCPPTAVDEWVSLLAGLLHDLVTNGKCEVLSIRRGGYVHTSNADNAPMDRWDANMDCLAQMINKMRIGDSEGSKKADSGAKATHRLTNFTICHSPFLAQPSFAPFLRSAFTSPTLTSITIRTLSLTDPLWDAVLGDFQSNTPGRLHMPALQNLTLRNCVVRFAALKDILVMHASTLRSVDLSHTVHPYGDSATIYRVTNLPVSFPHLHTLKGISTSPSAFPEALLSGKYLALPSLTHLELCADFGYGAGRQHDAPVNRVLDALARGSVGPAHLTLALSGREGAVAWLQAVATQAQGPRARRLPICAFVKQLDVQLKDFVVGQHVLQRVMPHWLALFPGVEELLVGWEQRRADVVGAEAAEETEEEVDAGKVAQAVRAAGRCLSLKRITIGGRTVGM
ncbi:uncharacterized protein SCHCODRAFT_02642070 [Schizophyllum commune H4-8]|uniref:uncharacterized protein n=1 Tax=Schizophyllum commune (strain H4-8 / FGSC 9210) TaxID=578458 RepID=UPI00215E91A2|nr:uncharacterized protein SCHCODRAFT_02642070 [Schizophyllum commune H4-8]KAI5886581.1 hypothetical protein SCHCODRAFT_02642070 [Schizophyllum commune H4-8]